VNIIYLDQKMTKQEVSRQWVFDHLISTRNIFPPHLTPSFNAAFWAFSLDVKFI